MVGALSKLWQVGGKIVGAVGSVANWAIAHPYKAGATVIGVNGGWKALTSEKSFAEGCGEYVREATGSTAKDVINGVTGDKTVEKVVEGTKEVLNDAKGSISETKSLLGTVSDTFSGISSFLSNIFKGNGMNMFGGFFDNLLNGKVSGIGIGALIAGAYMMFGRTGLLGKIGGALMSMMMIGCNSQQQVAVRSSSSSRQHSEVQGQGTEESVGSSIRR